MMRILIFGTLAITIWSVIGTHDLATWFFELMLGAVGVGLLWFYRKKFLFSRFFLVVVLLHYIVLAVGAHYTYAEVPLFNWIREPLSFSRNHFDRVGHFMQGLTPALLAVEWLHRRGELNSKGQIKIIAVCVGLAFSALYEILEWLWVALFYPESGPEWLGMQGDQWDAQADMGMALCGALLAISLLSTFHQKSIAKRLAQSK